MKNFQGKLLIANIAFILMVIPVWSDPAAIMGSGNINENVTASEIATKLVILKSNGVKMIRLANSGYYDQYGTGGTSEKRLDSAMIWCYRAGITPTFLFEYYPDFPYPINIKSQWIEIGKNFATRFHPNSAWLVSQNILNWGVTIYQAINEPDINQGIDKKKYHDALEGLADGVHSVDTALKVLPGGYATPNAYSNYTCQGYAQAITDLLNNGKLDGIDLHTYASIWAPLAWYSHSSQHDFDAVKQACKVTRDINFYCSEFNYNRTGAEGVPTIASRISQDKAAQYFLTQVWDNLGVAGNNGTVVSKMVLAWTLFSTVEQDSGYGLCASLNPYSPVRRAETYALVARLSSGMAFTRADPKSTGEYELEGNGKKLWVFQNLPNWTNHYGTKFTINKIPSGSTKLEMYGWDGLRKTIPIAGKTSITVDSLQAETYMYLFSGVQTSVTNYYTKSTSKAGPFQKVVLFDTSDKIPQQSFDLRGKRITSQSIKKYHCAVLVSKNL